MGIFDKEIAVFRDIENSVVPTIIETINNFSYVLLDYNRNKQMNIKGENSKGEEIGSYSNGWKRIRVSRGLQTEHVDLNFTGRFQATLEVLVEANQFRIVPHVSYFDEIEKKYGLEVLGIQLQYLQEFVNNYIVPQLKKMINGKLAKS